MKSNLPLILLVAIVGGVFGYIYGYSQNDESEISKKVESQAPKKLEYLLAESLPDTMGEETPIKASLKQLNIINYWATWCAPCRHEMPLLQAFYDANVVKGVTVLGMTLDDPEPTEAFIQEVGVRYPIFMMGDKGWDILSASGNAQGLLPYTVLVDSEGNVLETKLGEIKGDLLENWLKKHLTSDKM